MSTIKTILPVSGRRIKTKTIRRRFLVVVLVVLTGCGAKIGDSVIGTKDFLETHYSGLIRLRDGGEGSSLDRTTDADREQLSRLIDQTAGAATGGDRYQVRRGSDYLAEK
jgi:hypothetical protein